MFGISRVCLNLFSTGFNTNKQKTFPCPVVHKTTQNKASILSFLPDTTLYKPRIESVNRLNDHYTMQCWENESRFHYLCFQVVHPN